MKSTDATRNLQFLRADHAKFDIIGKPALVLIHLQNNLVGGIDSKVMPDWMPGAVAGIKASGMVGKCKLLADTFRAKNLPVIFVHADGYGVGAVPEYGDLFGQIRAGGANSGRNTLSEEDRKKYWGVIPEMEFDPSKDELLCNWISSPWNYSGLDLMLQKHHADTVVWGGFALQSAVYSGCNGCSDHLFNTIMCVDAAYASVPKSTPNYHEGLNDVVAEAIIRVMAPAICQCTDTATVLEKLKAVPDGKAK